MENPYQVPYYVYSDSVNEFINTVYKFAEDHPEFQLNQYNDVMLLNGLKWDEEVMTTADISDMKGQAIMALIYGSIRSEHFCSGALEGFFKSGCIDKWLCRLQELN